MNNSRSHLAGIGSFLAGLAVCAQAADLPAREKQFLNLPQEARRLTGPLFWLHGDESPERLQSYLEKVAEGGNGCFTAESRPHSDWLGEGWYRDLGVCLEAAKRLDLKMWLFDEKWWPSGEVGGKVPQRFGSKYLEVGAAEVEGPREYRADVPADKLVAVLAGKAAGEAVDGDTLLDLTDRARDGKLTWDAPAGKWRVLTFTWRYSEGRGGRLLVDGASQDAVDWYLDTVYQPHYDHFSAEFGKTIVGYFYDEPETPGDWGTGVIPLLNERGADWKKALVAWKFALADAEEQVAAKYQYQDAFAETWGRTLYGGLSRWCREHGVQSIGHWLEHGHEYLHPRRCAGNMFQVQKYSDMGAIDAVFRQFVPGRKDDSTYQTPKLGSSISHAYGKHDDLAIVEIFGARGQDLTYPEMKWWTDHMHVSGINFHIPHSFNPRAPFDRDCPPYFYNGGYEPRWPLYRVYADYTARLSLMLTGGRHVCPVAFLFLGNSYHVGKSIPPEELTTALQDALFDCDWLPYDVFENDVQLTDRQLQLRQEQYKVLIVPAVEVIPYATLAKAKAFLDAGGVVVGYGMLPSKSATPGKTAADIAELREAIWGADAAPSLEARNTNPNGGRSYYLPAKPTPDQVKQVLTDDARIPPTLEVLEGDTGDWLHVLHRQKDGERTPFGRRDVFFVTNMNWDRQVRTFRLRVHADGVPEVWDAMRAEITSVPFQRNGDAVDLSLTLASCESALLVFSPTDRAATVTERPPRITTADVDRMRRIPVVRRALPEQPDATPAAPDQGKSLQDAHWIWHAADGKSVPPCTRAFRRSFELAGKPTAARLTLAVDNEYTVFINGKQVGQGSAWERPDEYDVLQHLQPGRNAIAVEAKNGSNAPNPAGAVASLVVRQADGADLTLRTDATWKSADKPAAGWQRPELDDSGWPAAAALGDFGCEPWGRSGAQLTLSPLRRADPFEGTATVPADALRDGSRVFLLTGTLKPEAAARVTVNGRDAGGFLCQPFRLDVTRILKPGDNRIRLEPFAPEEVWLAVLPPAPAAASAKLADPQPAASPTALASLGYPTPPEPTLTARASSAYPGYEPALAVDGDPATRWNSADDDHTPWFEVALRAPRPVAGIEVDEEFDRVRAWRLKAMRADKWHEVAKGTTLGKGKQITFDPVMTDRLRLTLSEATLCVSLSEVRVVAAGE